MTQEEIFNFCKKHNNQWFTVQSISRILDCDVDRTRRKVQRMFKHGCRFLICRRKLIKVGYSMKMVQHYKFNNSNLNKEV